MNSSWGNWRRREGLHWVIEVKERLIDGEWRQGGKDILLQEGRERGESGRTCLLEREDRLGGYGHALVRLAVGYLGDFTCLARDIL